MAQSPCVRGGIKDLAWMREKKRVKKGREPSTLGQRDWRKTTRNAIEMEKVL